MFYIHAYMHLTNIVFKSQRSFNKMCFKTMTSPAS